MEDYPCKDCSGIKKGLAACEDDVKEIFCNLGKKMDTNSCLWILGGLVVIAMVIFGAIFAQGQATYKAVNKIDTRLSVVESRQQDIATALSIR